MKIKVYRGLDQIGGCITEISTVSSRVFIDMGQNLPGCGKKTSAEQDKAMIDAIFSENPKNQEAVVYTHAHEDHVGLFDFVPTNVPQLIGEGAKKILIAKYSYLCKKDKTILKNLTNESVEKYRIEKEQNQLETDVRKLDKLKDFVTWKRTSHPESFTIGDISITPFFNCHSIYDSYMFLIEVEGKRIWHMGDFRRHGYMGKRLIDVLKIYAQSIDVLITEGTMLGRNDDCIHERLVSKKMEHMMQAFKYVFVLTSATDIERLAAIKEASKHTKKTMYVYSGLMNSTMRIFTRREGKLSKGLFSFNPRYYDESKHLKSMINNGFTMVVGSSHLDRVKKICMHLPPEETLLIYSVWDGYYTDLGQVKINSHYKDFRDAFHNVVDIHTSGHADCKTIEDVINTVNPKEAIIGIHRSAGFSLDSLNFSEDLKRKICNNSILNL